MKKELKNLYVFGYGVALLIPYFVLFKVLHLVYGRGGIGTFLIGFFVLLFILSKISSFKPVLNLWIAPVIVGVAYVKITRDFALIPVLLLAFAGLFLLLTIFKLDSLRPVYRYWMKAATFIGQLISSLVLILVYYFVFTPFGLVIRLMGKDLLEEKLDCKAKSYWQKREETPFDPKRYQQQF